MNSTPGASVMLYHRFQDSAAKNRDLPALNIGLESITYGRLESLAEAVAGKLLNRFGRIPKRIGLLAERSPQAYVGYLAIQRLGSSVLPLNPSFPPARTQYMIEASDTHCLLAEARFA